MQDHRITEGKTLLLEMYEKNKTLNKFNADGEESKKEREKLNEAIYVVLKAIHKL